VDEKSAIQALDRLDRRLPLSPGRAERHGYEYYRHGTLSLYAALNPQTGQLMGETAARHTSQEFVAFLEEIIATQPAERDVHVILDNFSAHRSALVNQFLQQHPNVRFHFTPTYSSWLNQVESWFSKPAARRDRPQHLHLSDRSQWQDHPLHPPLPKNRKAIPIEILGFSETDSCAAYGSGTTH
jgi:transposase